MANQQVIEASCWFLGKMRTQLSHLGQTHKSRVMGKWNCSCHQRVLTILRSYFCHPCLQAVWSRAADVHWLDSPRETSAALLTSTHATSKTCLLTCELFNRGDGQIQAYPDSFLIDPSLWSIQLSFSLLSHSYICLPSSLMAIIVHLHYSRIICLYRPTQSQ